MGNITITMSILHTFLFPFNRCGCTDYDVAARNNKCIDTNSPDLPGQSRFSDKCPEMSVSSLLLSLFSKRLSKRLYLVKYPVPFTLYLQLGINFAQAVGAAGLKMP